MNTSHNKQKSTNNTNQKFTPIEKDGLNSKSIMTINFYKLIWGFGSW